MSFGKKIIGGLVWGQIGMTSRTAICFIISILTARILGAVNYGVYASLTSLISLFNKLTDMGVSTVFSTYIPRYKSENKLGECSYLIRRIILLKAVVLLISCGLILCSADSVIAYIGEPGIRKYIVMTTAWFLANAMMEAFIFIVMANMDMRYYTAVEVSVSVFQLAGVLLLTQIGMTVTALIILMLLVRVIQLLCYGFRSLSTMKPTPIAIDLGPVTRFGAIMWLSTVLQYFRYKSVDVFMILYFLKDPASVAYYDIAYLLVFTGGAMLLSAHSRLVIPAFSEAYTRFGIEGLRDAWRSSTKLTIYLAAPIYVFLIAHSDSIIKVFYSDAYIESSSLIVGLSVFTLIGVLLGSESSMSVVFPLNKEHIFLYVRGINGIVNVILNMILIPKFGLMGVVIATGGTTLLTSLVEMIIATRILKAQLPFDFIVKFSLILAVSISWTLFLKDMNIFVLICAALGYGIITTLLMLYSYRFTDLEKKMIRDFQPTVFNLLSRYKLLR